MVLKKYLKCLIFYTPITLSLLVAFLSFLSVDDSYVDKKFGQCTEADLNLCSERTENYRLKISFIYLFVTFLSVNVIIVALSHSLKLLLEFILYYLILFVVVIICYLINNIGPNIDDGDAATLYFLLFTGTLVITPIIFRTKRHEN